MMGLGKNLLISTRVPSLQFFTFWPVFLSRTRSSILCFCEEWAAREFHWHKIRRRRKNRNRKARAGKSLSRAATRDSFPPTPFLFARPSVQFLPREARQSVGISLEKGSSFVQQLRQLKFWRWEGALSRSFYPVPNSFWYGASPNGPTLI